MSLFPHFIQKKKDKKIYFKESFVDLKKMFLIPYLKGNRIPYNSSKGFCSYAA